MSLRPGDQELARPLRCRPRVARLVGELLSPPPILAVLTLVVAWDSSPDSAIAAGRLAPRGLDCLALVAWSRVQVGDHTPAQVLVGIGLGIVVSATIFPLLR